mgnify:FL=1
MVLVLMMITGVVLGFLFTTFYFEYNSSGVKTAALYGKIFLVVVAGGTAAAYCFTRSLPYMLSLGIGIGVGVSPFLTSKKEDTEQEDIKE